jgi:hypothetical protein
MKKTLAALRVPLRFVAGVFLLWSAWATTGEASECYNDAYCDWHIFQWDYCDVGEGGQGNHCHMFDTHECFTAGGSQCEIVVD